MRVDLGLTKNGSPVLLITRYGEYIWTLKHPPESGYLLQDSTLSFENGEGVRDVHVVQPQVQLAIFRVSQCNTLLDIKVRIAIGIDNGKVARFECYCG